MIPNCLRTIAVFKKREEEFGSLRLTVTILIESGITLVVDRVKGSSVDPCLEVLVVKWKSLMSRVLTVSPLLRRRCFVLMLAFGTSLSRSSPRQPQIEF